MAVSDWDFVHSLIKSIFMSKRFEAQIIALEKSDVSFQIRNLHS